MGRKKERKKSDLLAHHGFDEKRFGYLFYIIFIFIIVIIIIIIFLSFLNAYYVSIMYLIK